MKGKIILGLGTIGVTASTLSMVACGNTNKLKKDNLDSDTAKSTKEINKYPELTESFRKSDVAWEFVREKGKNYFEKYLINRPKHPSLHTSLDISLDGLWFTAYGNWGKKQIINDRGEKVLVPWIIVLNYHETYDYAHSKNSNLYPYLND